MINFISLINFLIFYLLFDHYKNETTFYQIELQQYNEEKLEKVNKAGSDFSVKFAYLTNKNDTINNKKFTQNSESEHFPNLFLKNKNESKHILKYNRYLKEEKEIEKSVILVENKQLELLQLSCINESSCNYRGRCFNETLCKCDPYFTTYYNKDAMKFNFTQCNYKQISLKTVFALSFFLGPMSFEHILIGNIATGIVKIIFPMIFILIGNSIFIMGKLKNNNGLQTSGKVFELVGTLIIIIWWFIDWILILSGYYKDNKNVDLFNDFFN